MLYILDNKSIWVQRGDFPQNPKKENFKLITCLLSSWFLVISFYIMVFENITFILSVILLALCFTQTGSSFKATQPKSPYLGKFQLCKHFFNMCEVFIDRVWFKPYITPVSSPVAFIWHTNKRGILKKSGVRFTNLKPLLSWWISTQGPTTLLVINVPLVSGTM